MLTQAIPQTFLTFVGDVVSDRFPRPLVWQICNIAACLLSIWISISVFTDTITLQDLVIRSFLFGIVLAFRTPSRQGVMAETVPREKIMSAVSINQMTTNILHFVGSAVAGFMISNAGIQWTYIAISLCIATCDARSPGDPAACPVIRIDSGRGGTLHADSRPPLGSHADVIRRPYSAASTDGSAMDGAPASQAVGGGALPPWPPVIGCGGLVY